MAAKVIQMPTKSRDMSARERLTEWRRQQQIAERAFELWLERGFRNGSPEEDLLQALHEAGCRRGAPRMEMPMGICGARQAPASEARGGPPARNGAGDLFI
jgi:hypothetical protein